MAWIGLGVALAGLFIGLGLELLGKNIAEAIKERNL
jgi:F0F1-type ATP synthase membrane subunit c/vacuolar-type H+-ATPase subunit K